MTLDSTEAMPNLLAVTNIKVVLLLLALTGIEAKPSQWGPTTTGTTLTGFWGLCLLYCD